MPYVEKEQIIERVDKRINNKERLVVCSCTNGLLAKAAIAGGADFMIADFMSEKRMLGFDAIRETKYSDYVNRFLMDLAQHLILVSENTPVIASVNLCNDFEDIKVILKLLKDKGYSGVMNMPIFSEDLPSDICKMEYDLICEANKMGFYTMALIRDEEQIEEMYHAGADAFVVLHKESEVICNLVRKIRKIKQKNQPVIVCKPDEVESEKLVQFVKETNADGIWGTRMFDSIPIVNLFKSQIEEYQKLVL